jgi:hypothetical protein
MPREPFPKQCGVSPEDPKKIVDRIEQTNPGLAVILKKHLPDSAIPKKSTVPVESNSQPTPVRPHFGAGRFIEKSQGDKDE